MLLNGRRAGTGNVAMIMTRDIERVEIVRGPGAVQYGSAAMGGVTNIITRQGDGPVSGEVFGSLGSYDFGRSALARRMTEQVVRLRVESRVWRMPPPEVLFLHRKLGGLYMLCTRLAASVNVGRLVEPYLAERAA